MTGHFCLKKGGYHSNVFIILLEMSHVLMVWKILLLFLFFLVLHSTVTLISPLLKGGYFIGCHKLFFFLFLYMMWDMMNTLLYKHIL